MHWINPRLNHPPETEHYQPVGLGEACNSALFCPPLLPELKPLQQEADTAVVGIRTRMETPYYARYHLCDSDVWGGGPDYRRGA